MITRIQASFIVVGDRFAPSKVPMEFSEAADPGSIGKAGRYRGRPVPNGSASLDAPEDEQSPIGWIHARVRPHLAKIRKAGGEDFTLFITYHYDSQCALSFTREELQMVLDLGCSFLVDCEQEEKKRKPNQRSQRNASTMSFSTSVSAVRRG